jgi:hypothetical protein
MEDIDKINLFLGVLVFIGFLSAGTIVMSTQKYNPVYKTYRTRPVQSQAIIKANQPLVIKPVQKKKSSRSKPKGVKEQNLFRKKLTQRKEHIKYNKFINGGEYADFLGYEPNHLTESQIEEKNVVNKLFGFNQE